MRTYLFLLILLVSCKSEVKPELTPEQIKINHIKDSITKAKKDSLAIVKAELDAYNNRPWKVKTFVDDFGDATNDKFITTYAEGTFSNSATANSDLYAQILITKKDIGIFLKEYSNSRPATKFIGIGTILLKNSNNKTLTIYSYTEWNNAGGLKVNASSYKKLTDFISNSKGIIKVAIKDKYSSSYSFNIDASGFMEELKKI